MKGAKMTEQEDFNVDITNDDISGISSYIKSKNTAVLTIMFTDIKGFVELTESLGEEQAKQIRMKHDEVLQRIIERDNDGLIIKYIGDAVMAIFSEPSAAVSRAVEIQQAIRELNLNELKDSEIAVRIGMHMGQVSVEDDVQADVFGSHVNRAARIESQADGGQIYLTYPVIDSAKGWLKNMPNIQWCLHGKYLLKGMTEGTEIYEVFDAKMVKPVAPKKAKKQTNVPKGAFAAALVGLGFLAAVLMSFIQSTKTWLLDFYPQQVVLDNTRYLELEGAEGDPSRLVKTDIEQGEHLLYYQVADGVRYYAEIEVQYGENKLKPKFIEHRIPSLVSRLSVKPDEPKQNEKVLDKTVEYSLYKDVAKKIAYQTELRLMTTAKVVGDEVTSEISGSVVVNGQEQVIQPISVSHNIPDKKVKRGTPVQVFEDQQHIFYLDYSLYKRTVTAAIRGQFKDNPMLEKNH